MIDRFNHKLIAEQVSRFLIFQGAKIESVATEFTAGTGVTASGLEVTLDVPMQTVFTGRMQDVNWFAVQATVIETFRQTIRARVQGTWVPPDDCKRQVGKLDAVDSDGNSVKIKFARGTEPAGHVLRIGDEVYGIILSKALTTRHRVILDRPLADRTLARATPVYGCLVGATNLPSFQGVTVVSNPLDNIPEAFNQHEAVNNLHVRVAQTVDLSGNDRFQIDMVCGLHVEPTKASMR